MKYLMMMTPLSQLQAPGSLAGDNFTSKQSSSSPGEQTLFVKSCAVKTPSYEGVCDSLIARALVSEGDSPV